MMDRKKQLKLLAFCFLIVVTAFALGSCGEDAPAASGTDAPADQQAAGDTYEIRITGDEDNEAAAELLALMNQYREDQGMDALEWNDEPAEMLRVRAAELAIDFLDTRLDGTPGEETARGSCDSIEEGAGQLLKDEGFERLLQDPENRSFCAGVYLSYSGQTYIAAGLYAKAGVKDAPSAPSKERTFTLSVVDDSLNCYGQLMDQEMEPEDPKELYQGESYYYCIFNKNAADGNKEELIGMVAESSDPKVVSINEFGDVEAKAAGAATLTVRPAKGSGIEFVQEVKVRK